jgi:hypothetical protein
MAVEVKQVEVEKFAKTLSVGPAAQAGPSAEAARHRVLRRGRPAGETGTRRPDPAAARAAPKKPSGGRPGPGKPTGGKPTGSKPSGGKPKPGFRPK